jgi:hypothetical protein
LSSLQGWLVAVCGTRTIAGAASDESLLVLHFFFFTSHFFPARLFCCCRLPPCLVPFQSAGPLLRITLSRTAELPLSASFPVTVPLPAVVLSCGPCFFPVPPIPLVCFSWPHGCGGAFVPYAGCFDADNNERSSSHPWSFTSSSPHFFPPRPAPFLFFFCCCRVWCLFSRQASPYGLSESPPRLECLVCTSIPISAFFCCLLAGCPPFSRQASLGQ